MAEQYALAAARVAVAQLAEECGFDAVHQSALEMMSELMVQYIEEIGAGAHLYSEHASRVEPNPLDVMLSLNDMGVSLTELNEYTAAAEKSPPFYPPIADFPLRRAIKPVASFAARGETAPAHIPAYLPAFPDEHTYRDTTQFPGDSLDLAQRSVQAVEAAQGAEAALVKLAARMEPGDPVLRGAGPEEAGPSGTATAALESDDPGREAGVGDGAGRLGHPLWAPPLWEEVAEGDRAVLPEPGACRAEPRELVGAGEGTGGGEGEWVPVEPALLESAARVAQSVFAPWTWAGGAIAADDGAANQDAMMDAFEESVGAATVTKAGRLHKRSARALESGQTMADPLKRRVQELIAGSAADEGAVASTGMTTRGAQLAFHDDEDFEEV